jgi:hypothetical protein
VILLASEPASLGLHKASYNKAARKRPACGRKVSGSEFIDAALSWFGDSDPRVGTTWEKGERLAKLVAHRRTLLVLDGLEPLQMRLVHKKDAYVSLLSRRSCANSLASVQGLRDYHADGSRRYCRPRAHLGFAP